LTWRAIDDEAKFGTPAVAEGNNEDGALRFSMDAQQIIRQPKRHPMGPPWGSVTGGFN
jgi:hypothetical protein